MCDDFKRLQEWNNELLKLVKQAQQCMEIWQKSEDELIEFHQAKSLEQLVEQNNEIERLCAEVIKWKTAYITLKEGFVNRGVQ
jgi:hypothetical protein